MISSAPEECLHKIANIFIGDEGEFYSYKSGPKLIEFFYGHFGFDDSYGQGFPSRWAFVTEKLSELINDGRIDEFFTLILSYPYIAEDNECNEVEAADKVKNIIAAFKKAVSSYGFDISYDGVKYMIIEKNSDLEPLGHGGFADCYKQISTGLVVKKLQAKWLSNEGVRSRFKREYTITKELQDINGIIRVYDFDPGNFSYTMELADDTLYSYLSKHKLDDSNKAKCIHIILRIMAEVHKRGKIHRDLSFTNIFIKDNHIKIADFGLGKDLSTIASHQTMYTRGFGQPLFCAPEQLSALKDADKRSDVFALGRVINYIMTGNPLNARHSFRIVTDRATNNDPDLRYTDAGDMLDAFIKAVEYQNTVDIREEALRQIHNGQYSGEVENFLYDLDGEKICRYLVKKERHFDEALLKLMAQDDAKAISIIGSINSCYQDVCTTFASYDPIADFAYDCISGINHMVNVTAARILHYIAWDVNRFHAQHLIDALKGEDIDPEVEDIISK